MNLPRSTNVISLNRSTVARAEEIRALHAVPMQERAVHFQCRFKNILNKVQEIMSTLELPHTLAYEYVRDYMADAEIYNYPMNLAVDVIKAGQPIDDALWNQVVRAIFWFEESFCVDFYSRLKAARGSVRLA